jgi:outer membrane receptor protein involved in Fe transport
MIGYTKMKVENVKIPGTLNVSLKPEILETAEVVVTAEALKTTEASVLKIQKTASAIVDGMSSELISKNNSSDGADILKRMTGITISEGKYAFVRGVGDRYNNTLLNGAVLPSTDPEKKSFAYDIFPANLIENIITAKTFTPDKPADFTGGLVQISTIEFPNKLTIDFSGSAGFLTGTTFSEFRTYNGGSKDFLGYDDGTRQYPKLINSNRVVRGNYSETELQSIASSFNNNWKLNAVNAPLNSSYKLSVGDNYRISDNIFGYIASLNYSSSFESYQRDRAFYDFDGARYNYVGAYSNHNIMLGGMLNLSFKFSGKNKLTFKNVFNQNADDEVTINRGEYRYAGQYREITALKYVSRTLRSHQLGGQHSFAPEFLFDWGISYSNSKRNEPDLRRFVYARDLEEHSSPLSLILDQALVTRFFGELDDNDYGLNSNFSIKPFTNQSLPKISLGLLLNAKNRKFDARIFGFRNGIGGNFIDEQKTLLLPIDQIFVLQNIRPDFITITEITLPSDSYTSEQKVAASYIMIDPQLTDKIKIITGVRFEYSQQILNSRTITNDPVNINNIYRDWLPSLNVIYQLNHKINLRFGYNKTLARPEFREIAPFSYFDFIANELVQGNPALKRALIENVDIKFEYFPTGSELFAASLYYKNFKDPIELILVASSSNEPIKSFANANSAINIGAEFEIRKNLSFISDLLNNLSLVSNLSLIRSRIKLDNSSESNSFQKSNRPLQGQPNYIINFGVYFDNIELGLNSSLTYNRIGDRISKVGVNDLGDVIEKPVDQIDYMISMKLLGNFTLKFAAKDLLNQSKTFIQRTKNGDKIVDLYNQGSSFSLGFSYQF